MPTSLETRVTRLERQNRLLRAALLLGAAALVTCGVSSKTSNFRRVNTETLVIVSGDKPQVTITAAGMTFRNVDPPVTLDGRTVARLLAAQAEE